MLDAKESDMTGLSEPANGSSEVEREQTRLVEALAELYDLLETYAPSWYTAEHHEKAESALQSVKVSSRH